MPMIKYRSPSGYIVIDTGSRKHYHEDRERTYSHVAASPDKALASARLSNLRRECRLFFAGRVRRNELSDVGRRVVSLVEVSLARGSRWTAIDLALLGRTR